MNKNLSPYYPPRARWHSSLFQAADGIRRRVGLDAIHLGEGLPGRFLVCGLLVPGLAFYLRGQRRIGQALVACGALLAVVFIIWLGYPLANMAFGLLLSLHTTSILFLFSPWLAEVRLPYRVMLGMALLTMIGAGVYGPLRNLLQRHCWMPLRVHGRVVVVQKWSSARSVQRGEW